MVAPLRRLHRYVWFAWIVVMAVAVTLVLAWQP